VRISVKHRPVAEAPVIVTAAARENLVLRAFVRQAVPMLKNPEAFSAFQRQQLATTLERAVPGCQTNKDTESKSLIDPTVASRSEYEPGMDWP
jgi:hypothetical protein